MHRSSVLLYSATYITIQRHLHYYTAPPTLSYSATYIIIQRHLHYHTAPPTLLYSATYIIIQRHLHYHAAPPTLSCSPPTSLYNATYIIQLYLHYHTAPPTSSYSATYLIESSAVPVEEDLHASVEYVFSFLFRDNSTFLLNKLSHERLKQNSTHCQFHIGI